MNREQHSETPSSANFGPSELANMFFRHKKKAFLFALSVVTFATLIILYAPRKYRSEARVFLQVGRESIRLDPTATTGKTMQLQQAGRDAEVATSIEVLKSRAICEKAVDALTPEVVLGRAGSGQAAANPVYDLVMAPLKTAVATIKGIDPISLREEAVIEIEKNLAVDSQPDSTIIRMTYDAETAVLAQQVMKTIVAVYQDEHARLHRTSGSKPFFTQQRDDLEKQLAAAEGALREAKNRMNLGSIESRRNTLETRLSNVELTLNRVTQLIAGAEAQFKEIESQVDELPETTHLSTTVLPNTGADTLRSQLYELQVELMKLEAKYKPDHPFVTSARQQVDNAKGMLQGEEKVREETVEQVNANHQTLELQRAQVENQLAGYRAELKKVEQQKTETLTDLRELNDHEVEIQELDRAATLARNKFFGYSEDLEQARVDEELNIHRITNVAVAQEATLGEKPISPSKLLVGALSLMLLGAGTIALVLVSEKLDGSLRNEEQVEQILRLPVLATVPEGRAYASVGTARKG